MSKKWFNKKQSEEDRPALWDRFAEAVNDRRVSMPTRQHGKSHVPYIVGIDYTKIEAPCVSGDLTPMQRLTLTNPYIVDPWQFWIDETTEISRDAIERIEVEIRERAYLKQLAQGCATRSCEGIGTQNSILQRPHKGSS